MHFLVSRAAAVYKALNSKGDVYFAPEEDFSLDVSCPDPHFVKITGITFSINRQHDVIIM